MPSTYAVPTTGKRHFLERPEGIGQDDYHGWQFVNMHTDNWKPAVAAGPVWFFGEHSSQGLCMPESATVIGAEEPTKNPGTHINLTINQHGEDEINPDVGRNCNDPAARTKESRDKTHAFPNYITWQHCGGRDNWMVTYSLYYVHDSGHMHDWESATVVWSRTIPGQDWWRRTSLILSHHNDRWERPWHEIETSQDEADVEDGGSSTNKLHPHVYSGLYSHANFFGGDEKWKAWLTTNDEYRTDDWYFMPKEGDMKSGKEIDTDWYYGSADSTPGSKKVVGGLCTWQTDKGGH